MLGFGGARSRSLVLLRLAGLVRAVERARRAERLARREAEQAQQLLAYQNEQLVELDRLKDEFVSSVSHELRTPLTSISGYVELLLEDETDDETRTHLAIVDRNAERLLGLVTDLLFAARLQDGQLELDRTSRRPAASSSRRASSRRGRAPRPQASSSTLRRCEPCPLVDGESARLAQLLDNLVSNAIKFTPAGGSVAVSARAARRGRLARGLRHRHRHPRGGARAALRAVLPLADARSSGRSRAPGSASTSRRRSSRPTAAGSGSQQREGEGTTFVVELPVAAMSDDSPLVLCADDDEDILSLVALRLERAGYEVVHGATTGRRRSSSRAPASRPWRCST